MIDKIIKTIQDTGQSLIEQTSQLGSGAKEKTFEIINDWLKIFPQLEAYGLEVESFSLGVAISPSVEVELKGKHEDFTEEKLRAMLDEADDRALRTVISTINTTYSLHRKITEKLEEPLIVQVRISISPEVKVFIGEPLIRRL